MQISQRALQLSVIGLGVLAFVLVVANIGVMATRHSKKALHRDLEARVYEAERNRLAALVTFFQQQGQQAPSNPQTSLWTFQAASQQAVMGMCPHGLLVPPENVVQNHPGYQAAFVGTCHECFPQYTLAENNMITYQQPFQHAPASYGIQPHIQGRIRRVRNAKEMPRGPPPVPPPGFVAVPMVVES